MKLTGTKVAEAKPANRERKLSLCGDCSDYSRRDVYWPTHLASV